VLALFSVFIAGILARNQDSKKAPARKLIRNVRGFKP